MDVLASKSGPPGIDPIASARAWLDEAPRVALATVVATWGASPVPAGGQLAIAPGERFQGSVSGGCVEAEVISEASGVIASGKPRLLAFGVGDETAWRSGLPCGGRIEIFVEALEGAEGKSYLDGVLAARESRTPLVIETRLTDGARTVHRSDAPVSDDIAAAMRSGRSRLVETPRGSVFLHALVPPVHLIVVGATHIGQVLTNLAARIGWKVSVVDPRSAFATEDRFVDTARHTEWPEASLGALVLDPRTAVVAVTHVGRIDDEALLAALRSPSFYVGALGSKRTHAARVERLRAAGASEADIARIRAPIGLDIGSEGPEEIAISILAEIVRDLRAA